MQVRTLTTVTTPQGEVPPGAIITIPAAVFDRLRGKVEIVTMTGEEAAKKISSVLVELDNQNPWIGKWKGILNEKGLELIRLANLKIDHAADILRDPEALDAALLDYRQAWVEVFAELEDGTATSSTEESISACRIDGGTCTIGYTPDLYQQHRHRDGKQITVDGISAKIIIEEITP